jgi:predicted SAM-dependent methyltransferase
MTTLNLAPSSEPVKLDLAAGQTKRAGFRSIDIWEGADERVDLLKFPWPWPDNYADELFCSHFVEHIPAREVEVRDLRVEDTGEVTFLTKQFVGQDMFFAFFDECWRILKPGAGITVDVPCGRSNRAFQDPTHRRFIMMETFFYLMKRWREEQKLDHYRVRCNFDGACNPVIMNELAVMHPEVQARRFNAEWNAILDWHVTMTAVK